MNVEVARRIKSGDPASTPTKKREAKQSDEASAALPTLISAQHYSSQAQPRNHELEADLDDSRCVVAALHDELKGVLLSWCRRWQSWCDANASSATAFDAQFTYVGPPQVSMVELEEELRLQLTSEWLTTHEPTAKVSLTPAQEAFEALSKFLGPQLREERRRTLALSAERLLTFGPADAAVTEGIMELHQFHHSDPLCLLRASLSKSFPAVAGLEAQIAQTMEERDACLRQEDIVGAEHRSQQLLSQMARVFDVVAERHDAAVEAESDVTTFEENLATLLSSLQHGSVAQLIAKHKRCACDDERVISSALEARAQQHREEESRLSAESQRFREMLQANGRAQRDVWDTITSALEQLNVLTTERSAIVEEHCAWVVDAKKRACYEREATTALEARLNSLQAVVEHLNRGEQFMAMAEAYRGTVEADVAKADAQGKLRRLARDERLRMYDAYKRFALFAAGAQLRKEQRLDNVRRLMRTTMYQIQNATHSLDTDLPLYKTQLEALRSTEQELLAQIGEMKLEFTRREEQFAPILHILDAVDCAEVEPPQLLVQELRRDLMHAHVEAMDELTNNEQKVLDAEKVVVHKIQNACDATKSVLNERRQTRLMSGAQHRQ